MAEISRRALLGAVPLLAAAGLTGACDPPPAGSTTPSADATAPFTGDYIRYADLAYAAPVGRGHLLDIYVPTTAGGGPFPVVVHQAGAAFLSDDTKSGPGTGAATGSPGPATPAGPDGMTTAASLAARWGPKGYAVVGLNVRSSGQARFPAQLHDVKAAIRWLRANAVRYNLDQDRLAAMGTGHGGWVAAMAGLTAGSSDLEGDLGNAGQRSTVQAVIDLSGPTDFLRMDATRLPGTPPHDPATSPESRLMGFPIQSDPAAVRRADPGTYVRPDSPPIWIAHGRRDPVVPFNQSELLFGAYQRAGATATLTLVPGAAHTDGYLTAAGASAGRSVQQTTGGRTTGGSEPPPTYDTLLAFLDTHLT